MGAHGRSRRNTAGNVKRSLKAFDLSFYQHSPKRQVEEKTEETETYGERLDYQDWR